MSRKARMKKILVGLMAITVVTANTAVMCFADSGGEAGESSPGSNQAVAQSESQPQSPSRAQPGSQAGAELQSGRQGLQAGEGGDALSAASSEAEKAADEGKEAADQAEQAVSDGEIASRMVLTNKKATESEENSVFTQQEISDLKISQEDKAHMDENQGIVNSDKATMEEKNQAAAELSRVREEVIEKTVTIAKEAAAKAEKDAKAAWEKAEAAYEKAQEKRDEAVAAYNAAVKQSLKEHMEKARVGALDSKMEELKLKDLAEAVKEADQEVNSAKADLNEKKALAEKAEKDVADLENAAEENDSLKGALETVKKDAAEKKAAYDASLEVLRVAEKNLYNILKDVDSFTGQDRSAARAEVAKAEEAVKKAKESRDRAKAAYHQVQKLQEDAESLVKKQEARKVFGKALADGATPETAAAVQKELEELAGEIKNETVKAAVLNYAKWAEILAGCEKSRMYSMLSIQLINGKAAKMVNEKGFDLDAIVVHGISKSKFIQIYSNGNTIADDKAHPVLASGTQVVGRKTVTLDYSLLKEYAKGPGLYDVSSDRFEEVNSLHNGSNIGKEGFFFELKAFSDKKGKSGWLLAEDRILRKADLEEGKVYFAAYVIKTQDDGFHLDGYLAEKKNDEVVVIPTPDPEEEPGEEPGDDPGNEPGNDPGNEPGDEPGNDPGNEPGDEPGNDPGNEPDNDPGNHKPDGNQPDGDKPSKPSRPSKPSKPSKPSTPAGPSTPTEETTTIEDPDVPLAGEVEIPKEGSVEEPTAEIPENQVPLAGLPQTGGLGVMSFVGAGAALAALGRRLRRK